MKVVQVMAGDTHGGAENFFLRLVTSLQKAGIHQYAIIKPHFGREAELKAHSIPVKTAHFNRHLPFLTRSMIRSVISAFQPDIVLSWMSRASTLCPRGSFVHVGRLGGYYDLKYYQKCDHLIGNTRDIITYFKSNQWPENFCHYLPNFVIPPSTEAKINRAQFETPDTVPLLLTLGRLHDDKAFDVLIKSLSLIPEAYLWIAGVGDDLSKLIQLAQTYGVAERVKFIGWHEDITPLYNTCDIYVCPSRIEPLGNVVLEAWAHKKPVVAAKSKGPAGLIRDKETGVLVEIEDWQGLAHALNNLIATSPLQRHLSLGGYAEFEQSFTEEKVVDQYLTFFKQILGKKRR